MFSLLFNTPLLVKQGAAPAGMDPFSPAFNQMSASVDPAVYIGLLKLGIALLCLTFVLFAWRKLASHQPRPNPILPTAASSPSGKCAETW